MARYEYIKVRASEDERRFLAGMVANGEAASLSDAVRKLAFGSRLQGHDMASLYDGVRKPDFDRKIQRNDIMLSYLQEISGVHNALAELVRSGVASDKLTEADVVLMEREVRRAVQNAAKLSREIRRGM